MRFTIYSFVNQFTQPISHVTLFFTFFWVSIVAATVAGYTMPMDKRTFANWRELAQLDYFDLLPDGRLSLAVDGLDGIIDFHTHFGFTFVIAKPIDLMAMPELRHNFDPGLPVNLDLYSGEDFHNVRPRWANEDYTPCALAWAGNKKHKHFTHTVPNILWEMDALKIEKSISLCLDITNSKNSDRLAEAVKNEPRIVFYCSVHPRDKHAEEKMRRHAQNGALGMKLHPELHRTAIDDPVYIEHIKLWKEITGGLPILSHSGFNGFEPEKVREHGAIEKFNAAIEAAGDMPFVLGHSAMNQYKIAAGFVKKYSNVWLEIGGQPPAHVRDMLDTIGDERLLYGTDWPVYPQAMPMAKILIATEDAPRARVNILRDNARGLLDASEKIHAAFLDHNKSEEII